MIHVTLREAPQRAWIEYIGAKWQSFKSYCPVYLITDALLAGAERVNIV